jgi:hypothetical protein
MTKLRRKFREWADELLAIADPEKRLSAAERADMHRLFVDTFRRMADALQPPRPERGR